MFPQRGRGIRTAFAVMFAMLCCLSQADAARYSGSWDPLYGFPFEGDDGLISYNLGWRGEAKIFVPDDCAPTGASGVTQISILSNPCSTFPSWRAPLSICSTWQPTHSRKTSSSARRR